MSEDEEFWDLDISSLAAEAELGYWCREPLGHGKICGQLGRPVDLPLYLQRPVLCPQHRLGWGREL